MKKCKDKKKDFQGFSENAKKFYQLYAIFMNF